MQFCQFCSFVRLQGILVPLKKMKDLRKINVNIFIVNLILESSSYHSLLDFASFAPLF